MEIAIGVTGIGLCAATIAWLRCPVTLSQAYRRIAGELILRAMAREARAAALKDNRQAAMTLVGAVRE